jgi:hypothetical protein
MNLNEDEPETTLSLREVARRLDRAGITWAVFAGAAAAAYGATRSLTDVDILIPLAKGDRAAALFPEAPVRRQEDGAFRGIKLPGCDLVAGLTMRDADATCTVDLDDRMAERLTHHEIAGVTVPVIPPEDNILLKAVWLRGPEVGKHDWEDVQAMMTHLPALDWAYLRWRAGTCGTVGRVQQAVERLEELWRGRDAVG